MTMKRHQVPYIDSDKYRLEIAHTNNRSTCVVKSPKEIDEHC